MSHIVERKEFIQSKELKNKYEDESNSPIQNILTREDGANLPLLEGIQEVKLLGKEEKVLGFEEYIKSKNKAV